MSDVITDLFNTIMDRKEQPRPGSYTNQLLSEGEDEIVKKIGEEAIEVILATKSQGDKRLIEELADLLYHILVLLAARNLTWDDILLELSSRRR